VSRHLLSGIGLDVEVVDRSPECTTLAILVESKSIPTPTQANAGFEPVLGMQSIFMMSESLLTTQTSETLLELFSLHLDGSVSSKCLLLESPTSILTNKFNKLISLENNRLCVFAHREFTAAKSKSTTDKPHTLALIVDSHGKTISDVCTILFT